MTILCKSRTNRVGARKTTSVRSVIVGAKLPAPSARTWPVPVSRVVVRTGVLPVLTTARYRVILREVGPLIILSDNSASNLRNVGTVVGSPPVKPCRYLLTIRREMTVPNRLTLVKTKTV